MIIRNKLGQFVKGTKFWEGKKRPNISLKMSIIKKGQWTGDKNPLWKGGKKKKTCLQCGNKYFVRPYAIKRSKFCSRSCKGKFLFTGSKNNKWKGGITTERNKLKHSEEYKKWRLKVFQRDRFACKLCGYRSKMSSAHGDKKSDIEAHHIVPISENPKLCLKEGNGITLCEKCHKTYGRIKKFTKVFKEILRDYMSNNPKG